LGISCSNLHDNGTSFFSPYKKKFVKSSPNSRNGTLRNNGHCINKAFEGRFPILIKNAVKFKLGVTSRIKIPINKYLYMFLVFTYFSFIPFALHCHVIVLHPSLSSFSTFTPAQNVSRNGRATTH
jgi:hypothetical protein